jgi:hypothetical protein
MSQLSNKTKTTEKDTKMNFAIGNTQAMGWKRFKVGYVTVAAALTLAVTAAAGLAFTRDTGSGPSSPARIAQSVPQWRVQPSQAYIYVVGSQEEAIALEMGIDRSLTPDVLYEVLVVDTPEAEASFQLSQKELIELELSGALQGITLIDTR